MNFQMNHGTWLLLLTLAGSMPAELAVAEMPNQVERLGRLYGVCWGDGYHACRSSGFHPLADLPPVDRKAIKTRSHRIRVAPIGQRGATFYDRFDAFNQSRLQSGECESRGCDSGGWDAGSYRDGSYSGSPGHGPTNVQVIDSGASGATAPVRSELVRSDPVYSAPAKKRAAPFRPTAPVKPASPVVMPDLPGKPAEQASSDVQPILMPPLSSRIQQDEPHPLRSANVPSPRTISIAVPSYAAQPTPPHVVRSSMTPRGIDPIYPASSAATSPAVTSPTLLTTTSARPTRIGESPVNESPVNESLIGPSTQVNRPLGRPRVELAERVSASGGQVVRQPSYIK